MESGLGGVAQDAQRAGNFQAAVNRERTSGRFLEQHHVGEELPGQMQRSALARGQAQPMFGQALSGRDEFSIRRAEPLPNHELTAARRDGEAPPKLFE